MGRAPKVILMKMGTQVTTTCVNYLVYQCHKSLGTCQLVLTPARIKTLLGVFRGSDHLIPLGHLLDQLAEALLVVFISQGMTG